eukprot:TRINITY_DN1388_c0_g2_i2.p2 TRINITY_DN1388_c0_g2~~TRINITY_DN1388_c0_g2_i2.p2  ORF type:complete len:118 (+),score=24.72 TRINITY_DN1388_c0_g2_i2:330-683(+)
MSQTPNYTLDHWKSATGEQTYNYQYILANLFFCLAGVAMVDFIVLKLKIHPKARWFAVHAVANAVTVAFAYESAWAIFVDPYHAIDNTVSVSLVPILVISATHLVQPFASVFFFENP